MNARQLKDIAANIARARQASQEAEQWLRCVYLAPRVGEEFDATITMVNSTGFKARLADNGIEGQVDLQRSRSKFSFDRWTATLKSDSASYVLEQKIRVKLEQVDLDSREILLLPLAPQKAAAEVESDSAVQ